MGHVTVGGFDLYVEEMGSGPHLVIAHGMFGSVAKSASNGVVAREIAKRGFHVVQYDARGHGRSGATSRSADYCWEALAEELLGVIDALGLEQVSVLGTSMGAGAALLAALTAPDRIERLVLRTPPAMGPDVRRVRWRLGAVKALYRWLGTTGATAALSAFGQAGAFAEQQAGVVPAAIEGMLFGRSELPEARMAEIRCPALILTHPGDPDHPLRSGEALARMPNSVLCVAPRRGHWRTHPEELTNLVASFLRGEPINGYSPPMNAAELHAAGAIVRHRSPFAALRVPSVAAAIGLPDWSASLFRIGLFEPDETVALLGDYLPLVDADLVLALLSTFDWRPRIIGAHLAALRGLISLEEDLGNLLLRSDVCYAGAAYALTLAHFNTPRALQLLTDYLDYYLTRTDLWFEQCTVLAVVTCLDERNGTEVAKRYDALWRAYSRDKPNVQLGAQVDRVRHQLQILESLVASTRATRPGLTRC